MKQTKLAYARTHTGDHKADQAQRLAQQTARKVNDLAASSSSGSGPFDNGVAVINVPITGPGPATVTHNLGVVPKGYLITRCYDASNGVLPGDFAGGSFTATTWDFDFALFGTVNFDLWFYV